MAGTCSSRYEGDEGAERFENTAEKRLATIRRCCVQQEIPWAVSGLNVLKVSSMASSDGMSPFLGPAAVPLGEDGTAGWVFVFTQWAVKRCNLVRSRR
jgi:hypothetical protein